MTLTFSMKEWNLICQALLKFAPLSILQKRQAEKLAVQIIGAKNICKVNR